MIIILTLLVIILTLGLVSTHLVRNNISKYDMKICLESLSKINVENLQESTICFLFLNYNARDFKSLDYFLNKTDFKSDQKYIVIFKGPEWMYEIRKNKWNNHKIVTKDVITIGSWENKYELICYQPNKAMLHKYETAFPILECMNKAI